MLASTLLAVFGLAATITAAPTKRDDVATLSANTLIGLAPSTQSCAGAMYPDECKPAEDAAHCINLSFQDYSITSFGVQAALVSLIMYESGNFSYSKHHFGPASEGQGTRNMQTAYNNQKYAAYLVNKGNLTSEALETATNNGPDAVLALVNTDHFSFASAAWYLMNQCDSGTSHDYYNALAEETDVAYTDYLVNCVGTDATPDRMAGYHAVQSLLHW